MCYSGARQKHIVSTISTLGLHSGYSVLMADLARWNPMSMMIPTTYISKTASHTAIAVVLLIAIGVSVVLPQTAQAQVMREPVIGISTTILTDLVSRVNPAQRAELPVAGDREPRRVMNVVATSYTSDPYQTDSTPCIPAMNYDLCTNAEAGIVDTIAYNGLPLGTQVRFPEVFGDKIFTVRDRMNARYNGTNRIDFYQAVLKDTGELDPVASKQLAINFGVQTMQMEIF